MYRIAPFILKGIQYSVPFPSHTMHANVVCAWEEERGRLERQKRACGDEFGHGPYGRRSGPAVDERAVLGNARGVRRSRAIGRFECTVHVGDVQPRCPRRLFGEDERKSLLDFVTDAEWDHSAGPDAS